MVCDCVRVFVVMCAFIVCFFFLRVVVCLGDVCVLIVCLEYVC